VHVDEARAQHLAGAVDDELVLTRRDVGGDVADPPVGADPDVETDGLAAGAVDQQRPAHDGGRGFGHAGSVAQTGGGHAGVRPSTAAPVPSAVLIAPPVALALSVAALGVEPALLRGRRWSRGPAGGIDTQRRRHAGAEPIEGQFAVARLRALGADHHPHRRAEALEEQRPLARARDPRRRHVPAELDPGVGGVGVLAARAAAPGEPPRQLVGRDPERGRDLELAARRPRASSSHTVRVDAVAGRPRDRLVRSSGRARAPRLGAGAPSVTFDRPTTRRGKTMHA